MGSEPPSAGKEAREVYLKAAGTNQVHPYFCEGLVSLSIAGQLKPPALSPVAPGLEGLPASGV